MDVNTIVFYLLSGMTLGFGLLAVTTRKIFRSAIYLLFSLVGIAGLYFWLQMEFLAAVQIIVYVGGIVVLIIFSIFLTQTGSLEMPPALKSRRLFAALASLAGFVLCLYQLLRYGFHPSASIPVDSSVAGIGLRMLDTGAGGYALPFELVSILLLAAMIGCIVIAIKKPGES